MRRIFGIFVFTLIWVANGYGAGHQYDVIELEPVAPVSVATTYAPLWHLNDEYRNLGPIKLNNFGDSIGSTVIGTVVPVALWSLNNLTVADIVPVNINPTIGQTPITTAVGTTILDSGAYGGYYMVGTAHQGFMTIGNQSQNVGPFDTDTISFVMSANETGGSVKAVGVSSAGGSGIFRAFLWDSASPGTYQDVSYLPGLNSIPIDINGNGIIVGNYGPNFVEQQSGFAEIRSILAAYYHDGTTAGQLFHSTTTSSVRANGINELNVAVGVGYTVFNAGAQFGSYSHYAAALQTIGTPEVVILNRTGDNSGAAGINNYNEVVGWKYTSSDFSRPLNVTFGVLWRLDANNVYQEFDLDTLILPNQWHVIEALDINDAGMILALAQSLVDTRMHFVLLNPLTPNPPFTPPLTTGAVAAVSVGTGDPNLSTDTPTASPDTNTEQTTSSPNGGGSLWLELFFFLILVCARPQKVLRNKNFNTI